MGGCERTPCTPPGYGPGYSSCEAQSSSFYGWITVAERKLDRGQSRKRKHTWWGWGGEKPGKVAMGVASSVYQSLDAIHSTKISGNFGPKLNGSVRSNRKSFEKTGPPFELVPFSRSDRLEFWLNGSRPLCLCFVAVN